MASTATTRNRLEKQGTGENVNTWGVKLNTTGLDLIDASLDGVLSFTLSGSKTLTTTNYTASESINRVLNITGGTGGTVTIPGVQKNYRVRNNSSGNVTITAGGVGVVIPSGNTYGVFCDGTDVFAEMRLDYGSSLLSTSGVPTTGNDLVNKTYADGLALGASLPGQAGNSGKFITTDGTTASWASITSATIGLGNVENKSSATIRGELSSGNVTTALTYTPTSVVGLTGSSTPAAFRAGLGITIADVTSLQTSLDAKAAISGQTFTGVVVGVTPSSGGSGYASFRLPHGVAPTTNITNGDVWTTTLGMFARINGATIGPFTAGATGYSQIASTTASGATVDFTSIPSSFSDLLILFEGVSLAGSGDIGIYISGSNGADYGDVPIGVSGFVAADAVYGSSEIVGYNNNAGSMDIALGTPTSGDAIEDASTTRALGVWRMSGGIDAVRVFTDSTFDAGTIRLLGR